MENVKNPRMHCYRCTRCQLNVYRHSIHYDRREQPICDPDCDGSKPGTCIWCEHVIVGRPMLMFDKKVHRECWQYCVAKFGYDAIVKRYSKTVDVKKLREKEVGEDMVREMVEEFFDKFCYEMLSDDEEGEYELPQRRRDFRGKKGELEWSKAIRRVLRNEDSLLSQDLTSGSESKTNEDTNQWRELSDGESSDYGSGRKEEFYDEMALKEMLAESSDEKGRTLHRVHSSEERAEWLQAVQDSLCGDAIFDRESWADTTFRETSKREQLLERSCRSSTSSNTSSVYEDQNIFVGRIIDEAMDVLKECDSGSTYKAVDGEGVINYDAVWERATRNGNEVVSGANQAVNTDGEYVDVRKVRGRMSLLGDEIIDGAAKDYVDTSDEELEIGVRESLLATHDLDDVDKRIRSMFRKSWDEARAFKSSYHQDLIVVGEGYGLEDSSASESNVTFNDDDQYICDYGGEDYQTTVDGNKSSKKTIRRKKPNDSDTSARETSGPSSQRSDFGYEITCHEDLIEKNKIGHLFDSNMVNDTESDRATSIANSRTEHILTEEQLDELFWKALVASSDPTRLSRLINHFKNAVGEIQHNRFTCRYCPLSHSSSAECDPPNEYSTAEHFDTVINQLMEDVAELNNSILIFRKYRKPEHLCEKSLGGKLVSTPQGEVYGSGNVLIIFDYGEECLKSDPVSVYEYLADINQEKESPRCLLHQHDESLYDFFGNNTGNVNEYDDDGITDDAIMSNDLEADGGSPISTSCQTSTDFDHITTYKKMFGEKDESYKSNSSSSRQCYGSEVEVQAYEAMLKAGENEESSEEFAASAKTLVRVAEKDTGEKIDNRELFTSKTKRGDTCNRLKTSMLSQADRKPTGHPTNKQIDRSIKRIKFDDSVTNLVTTGELHNSYVLRKSLSEGDVSSYEMCACSRYSEHDCTGHDDPGCTWTEERFIYSEEAPNSLHHSASLGTDQKPAAVYGVDIEITINKKADVKDTRKRDVRRSTSNLVLTPFVEGRTGHKEIIRSEDISNIARERLEQTTQEANDSEETQTTIVIDEDEDSCVTLRRVSIGETPNHNLIEESRSTNGLVRCDDIHVEGSKPSRASAQDELIVKYDSGLSKSNNAWKDSKDSLVSSPSEVDLSVNLSVDEIVVKESCKELDFERTNESDVDRTSSGRLGIDADLFFNDPTRFLPNANECHLVNARTPGSSVFDCVDSDEDLFRTALSENERDLQKSKDQLVGLSSDKELFCLKERNENFAKLEEDLGLCSPEYSSELNVNITQDSNNAVKYPNGLGIGGTGIELYQVHCPRSNTENQVESFGGEQIESKESGKCPIVVDIFLSTDTTESLTSSQENNEDGASKRAAHFDIDTGHQTNSGGEVVVKDSTRSVETDASSVVLDRSTEIVSNSRDLESKATSQETVDQHSSEEGVTLRESKRQEIDLKRLEKEDSILGSTSEPDIGLQTSLQPDNDVTKQPDIVCVTLTENENFVYSSPGQELVPSVSEQQKDELKTSQKPEVLFESFKKSLPEPLSSKGAICDRVLLRSKIENLIEPEFVSFIEEEIASLDLTEGSRHLYVLGTGSGTIKSSPKIRNLSKRRSTSQREDVLNSRSTVSKSCQIQGEFDRVNYSGDSTDEEVEVANVSEVSEYGVDHEWPIESLSETLIEEMSPVLLRWKSMGVGADPTGDVHDTTLAGGETRSRDPAGEVCTLGDVDCSRVEDATQGTSASKGDKKGKKDKKEKKKEKDKKKERKGDGCRPKKSPTCVIL